MTSFTSQGELDWSQEAHYQSGHLNTFYQGLYASSNSPACLTCMLGCDLNLPCRLLHTLRVRYTLDMIYTYSGNILIAVSPSLLMCLLPCTHHES